MKEQELLQVQTAILPAYDVEEVESVEARPTAEKSAEAKLRPMRIICLGDCVIPE